MARGGFRANAGRKSKWKNKQTKMIRVPAAIADRLLDIAQKIDSGYDIEFDSESKTIDLQELNIPTLRNKRFVFLEDLLKLGYEIKPLSLADSVRNQFWRTKDN